jgi:demethylmenaquinone methyltransferase/2-methoxy-6-polyprenyl-1,4-benzoquinol methylase
LETVPLSDGDVFAKIARKYDRINSLLSLGQDQKWRTTAVSRLPRGKLLDLGGGTGAANPVFGDREVVVLDPSAPMLALNPAPQRVVAVGERLPFDDGAFDAVFSAYVFRNLASVAATVAEMARVLRPGGKAGIVDLGRPVGDLARRAHRLGTGLVLNAVGLIAGAREEYAYLHHSLDKLPRPEELYGDVALRLDEVWRMGPLGFVYGAILVKEGG